MIYLLRKFLFGPPPSWEEYERFTSKSGKMTILFMDKKRGLFRKVYVE